MSFKSQEDIDSRVRSVTAEEVAHFDEHGWAMLRGFLDTDLVQEILHRAKSLVDMDGDAEFGVIEVNNAVGSDALLKTFADSSRFGEAAARLLQEPVAIRRLDDRLLVKPAGAAGKGTPPHQDHAFRPFKNNSMMFWIALTEVTPDMGSLHFYNGSHKLGLMGERHFKDDEEALERYPTLRRTQLTEAQHYMPGDASVHQGLTMHGTPANTSGRARWAYRLSYFPADANFSGESTIYTDGLGLEAGKPLDHPDFPVVYTP